MYYNFIHRLLTFTLQTCTLPPAKPTYDLAFLVKAVSFEHYHIHDIAEVTTLCLSFVNETYSLGVIDTVFSYKITLCIISVTIRICKFIGTRQHNSIFFFNTELLKHVICSYRYKNKLQ